ncbi:MAG: NAD(P)H-hydrate dehydratase [Phycisphaerales bacterium]|nr:NAD(P)H-hydrate dehydratase [Phycisphaerales bacterium]
MNALQEVHEVPALPARSRDGHKGTFGTAVLIGGAVGLVGEQQRMLGGPCLATLAALRSGCGLASLAMPEPLLDAGLTIVPEATGLPLPTTAKGELSPGGIKAWLAGLDGAHAVGIGPGLGEGPGVDALVAALLEHDHWPRVFDADALNAMAARGLDEVRGPAMLTPHPGEWRRLAEATGVDGEPIQEAGRPEAAAALARRLDAGGGPVVVVLKGAATVVSDGTRFWRSGVRESALAVGGSGDVLTGIATSLLAQSHPRHGEPARSDRLDLFSIACAAVHLHASAAEQWVAEHGSSGMLARDLVEKIPLARSIDGRV